VEGVRIRAVVTPRRLRIIRGASPTVEGRAAQEPDIAVDPISEAGVRLLDTQGLENYDDAGIDAVIEAVEAANGDTLFGDTSPEQAIGIAEMTAESDPAVQMALQENRFTPTPTPPIRCVGDCDGNGAVTVGELVKGVNIALGNAALNTCPQFEVNDRQTVTIDEIIIAVGNALRGCVG
jgi:hypothetical protein